MSLSDIEKMISYIDSGNSSGILNMIDNGFDVLSVFDSSISEKDNGFSSLLPKVVYSNSLSLNEKCKIIESAVSHGGNVNVLGDGINLLSLFAMSDGKRNERGDRTQLIKLLLDNGIDVNKVDGAGDTALIYNLDYSRDNDFIYLLKNSKANINIENNTGMTTLSVYINSRDQANNNKDIFNAILNKKPKSMRDKADAMIWAAQMNDNEAFDTLIKQGCHVNMLYDNGTNVMMQLARYTVDEPSIYLKLINMGCDLNHRDNDGYSLLNYLKDNDCSYTHDALNRFVMQKDVTSTIDNVENNRKKSMRTI